jgi:hypothetical protein
MDRTTFFKTDGAGSIPATLTYFYIGGLAERFIAAVLKMARDGLASLGSSNLPASVYAKNLAHMLYKLSTLSQTVSMYQLLHYK